MRRILVFGSLNVDLVQIVPRLAIPGETLLGGRLQIYMGGKGANQACAAARLGGKVRMAGKVGSDVFAERILREMRDAGVDTELIGTSSEPSGTAVIFVLPNGDNCIVISTGANADITSTFALDAVEKMDAGDILLCQLETPLEAVSAALRAAHARGMTTILDPAPARDLPESLFSSIDILTPNQTETAILLGRSEQPLDFNEAAPAAKTLRSFGARAVIIKMGAAGCWMSNQREEAAVHGLHVNVVDTTAAGDTFNGALGACLAGGNTLIEAVRFANAAAALSVTKSGAIASIPDLCAVDNLLQTQALSH